MIKCPDQRAKFLRKILSNAYFKLIAKFISIYFSENIISQAGKLLFCVEYL